MRNSAAFELQDRGQSSAGTQIAYVELVCTRRYRRAGAVTCTNRGKNRLVLVQDLVNINVRKNQRDKRTTERLKSFENPLNRDIVRRFRDPSGELRVSERPAPMVVGVGSVGTRCFITLLEGRNSEDPFFLQVKEANRSVLKDHLPESRYASTVSYTHLTLPT